MPIGPGHAAFVNISTDHSSVDRLLSRLENTLGPVKLGAFLDTQVGPYLAQRGESRFKLEGDDVSGKWIPLSVATENIRAKGRTAGYWSVGDSHPINVRTHELENFITSGNSQVVPQGAFGSELVYPDPSSAGFDIQDKMESAQIGKTHSGGLDTPPRPVLGVGETDMVNVLTFLAMFVGSEGGISVTS